VCLPGEPYLARGPGQAACPAAGDGRPSRFMPPKHSCNGSATVDCDAVPKCGMSDQAGYIWIDGTSFSAARAEADAELVH
jgi:hypothetical protein